MIEKDLKTAIAQDRRTFIKNVLTGTIAGSLLLVIPATAAWPARDHTTHADPDKARRFAFLVDITACIGCGSCCLADRTEYGVPPGRFRTWVERYVVDNEGDVTIDSIEGPPEGSVGSSRVDFRPLGEMFYVPKLCRMCEHPPCREVCPTGATYLTRDGFVLIDNSRCAGCSSCMEACPHSARFLDPRTSTAAKCTWCYPRVQKGLLPVCVDVCPVGARKFGDLRDEHSEIRRILHDPQVISVRKTTLANQPALYYAGWRKEVV